MERDWDQYESNGSHGNYSSAAYESEDDDDYSSQLSKNESVAIAPRSNATEDVSHENFVTEDLKSSPTRPSHVEIPLPEDSKCNVKLRIKIPLSGDGVTRAYMVDPYYEDHTSSRRDTTSKPAYATPNTKCLEPSNIRVRVRIPRALMPYRWRDPLPPIRSCLDRPAPPTSPLSPCTPKGSLLNPHQLSNSSILKRALSQHDMVDNNSWLTSSFIDLIFTRFARAYPGVHFMAVEFAAFRLRRHYSLAAAAAAAGEGGGGGGGARDPSPPPRRGQDGQEDMNNPIHVTDILGNVIDYNDRRPVVFFANIQNMHWNLVRAVFGGGGAAAPAPRPPAGGGGARAGAGAGARAGAGAWGGGAAGAAAAPRAAAGGGGTGQRRHPELQLFEPMGKPVKRGGGAGVSRGIPQYIIQWLNTCYPISKPGFNTKEDWVNCTYSAVTKQHQITGFDCGVACLLYAEKCGMGQAKEDIDMYTTQDDITKYREMLVSIFGVNSGGNNGSKKNSASRTTSRNHHQLSQLVPLGNVGIESEAFLADDGNGNNCASEADEISGNGDGGSDPNNRFFFPP